MRSNIKLFGPQIAEGLQQLSILADSLEDKPLGTESIVTSGGRTIIGEIDYYFEWKTEPTHKDIMELVSLIDERMKSLKTHYTITTETEEPFDIDNFTRRAPDGAFSFLKFFGPQTAKAISSLDNHIRKIPVLKEGKLEERELTLLGEFDYAFEWIRYPTVDEIVSVLRKIDGIIADSGVWYTITTKRHEPAKREVSKVQPEILKDKEEPRKITRLV